MLMHGRLSPLNPSHFVSHPPIHACWCKKIHTHLAPLFWRWIIAPFLPRSLTHSLNHPLTHSLSLSLTHSLTLSLTHSLTHSPGSTIPEVTRCACPTSPFSDTGTNSSSIAQPTSRRLGVYSALPLATTCDSLSSFTRLQLKRERGREGTGGWRARVRRG